MGGNVRGRRVEDLDDLRDPGDFWLMREDGKVVGMTFMCPSGDGRRSGIRFTGHQTLQGQPTWDWDGNEDAPTLTPSLHRIGDHQATTRRPSGMASCAMACSSPVREFHMIRRIPAVAVAALLLAGCAQLQAAKDALPVIADKVVDRAYGLTCGLPYRTEARFRARHDMSKETLRAWCKRPGPR